MAKSNESLYKILLIGNAHCGKGVFIHDLVKNDQSTCQSTIGVDFRIKRLIVNKEAVKLQVWDTSGQERFQTISSSYYRGAAGIFFVFDPTNRGSYDNLPRWIAQASEHARGDVARILVAMCYSHEGIFPESSFVVDLETEATAFAGRTGIPLIEVRSAEDVERATITMVTLLQCNAMDNLLIKNS